MSEIELTVLGRTLRGEVDGAVARHLDAQWVNGVAPVGLPAESIVMELETTSSLPPPDAPTVPGEHGLCYRPIEPDAFWVHGADPATGAVRVELADPTPRLLLSGRPFTAFSALDAALAEALAATGMIRLHAAVVTRGPATAVALLGPSGRGKSTTALRAALAGWGILAEDSCFVEQASLVASGADHAVHLRRDALGRLGRAIARIDPPTSAGDRHAIPFTALGGRVDHAVLTHLVHLRGERGPVPAWSTMTTAEGVMALHESCGVPLTSRVGRLHATWFANVVRRTTLLRLDPGPARSPLPELPG